MCYSFIVVWVGFSVVCCLNWLRCELSEFYCDRFVMLVVLVVLFGFCVCFGLLVSQVYCLLCFGFGLFIAWVLWLFCFIMLPDVGLGWVFWCLFALVFVLVIFVWVWCGLLTLVVSYLLWV